MMQTDRSEACVTSNPSPLILQLYLKPQLIGIVAHNTHIAGGPQHDGNPRGE
jgi:hypothetical protein